MPLVTRKTNQAHIRTRTYQCAAQWLRLRWKKKLRERKRESDILNEMVAKGDTSNAHDFTVTH